MKVAKRCLSFIQATWKVGIVIGVTRFGTVPVAMIEIVQQRVSDLAVN